MFVYKLINGYLMYVTHFTLDQVNLVKFIFYFFKIFGVATMTLNINNLHKSTIQYPLFCSSKIGVVYNVLIICGAVALNSLSNLFMHSDGIVRKLKFEWIIDVAHAIIVVVTTTFI